MADFEQIYKDYFRDVFLYLRRLSCGNERLAEDITSEAFFRAIQVIDTFRGDCDIRVWLCQIAKNCYYTYMKRHRNVELVADAELFDYAQEASPDEALILTEDAQCIKKILHNLPDPYKEVFMWRTLGDMSFKQIGELFYKTENWACVTYHRARKMIRKEMEVSQNEE